MLRTKNLTGNISQLHATLGIEAKKGSNSNRKMWVKACDKCEV